MKRTISLLLCLVLLLMSAVPCFAEDAEETELAEDPDAREANALTVRFWNPIGCTEEQLQPGESLTLAPGPEIEGYAFLGWQDAWGKLEARESLRVYEDTDYYAVYALAFGDDAHEPYLTLDGAGAFNPQGTMTRREAVLLVYRLLETDLVGDGIFLDLPSSDPCFAAAATLKTLGALSGSRFHPDETITRCELFALLSHFFPEAKTQPAFSDMPPEDAAYPLFALAAERGWIDEGLARADDDVTRIEAARIFNRILGRSADAEERYALVGTLLDVPRSDPGFWDVAEAVIPHSAETDADGEHWTESKPRPQYEEGLFFVGVRLHAVDENGDVVADRSYRGLPFNSRGELTSGSEELDALVWAAMEEKLNPVIMSQEEMLKAMFDYAAHEFRYVGRNHYEMGETGWEEQEALTMLKTGKGNCYSFAAIFYYFARALGYDPVIYSGTIRGDSGERRPHGWVEIEVDGEMCIFDAEMQYLYDMGDSGVSFYARDRHFSRSYGYRRLSDMD